jgi:hypothetical protein
MAEKYAVSGEQVVVWVPLRAGAKPGLAQGVKQPAKKVAKKPPKPKALTPWQTLLQQEGLFDG